MESTELARRVATVVWECASLLAISLAVILLYLPQPLEGAGWYLAAFGGGTVAIRWAWWLTVAKGLSTTFEN